MTTVNAQTKLALCVLFLSLSLSVSFETLAKGPSSGQFGSRGRDAVQSILPLDAGEQETLAWMREEEKLARDAYRVFHATWNRAVFLNIAESEQRHVDAILRKLDLFGLPDPALTQPGCFSNPQLQSLYDRLVAEGEESPVAALTVGAKIEEMDIRDLMAAIAGTNNVVLRITYENLLEASKNHLRTFVRQLWRQGTDYDGPHFIDPILYEAILGL
jgi:hypothetical protein